MVGDHIKDYKKAKAALRVRGYTDAQIKELFDQYTPHHLEDQKTLQFVIEDVHTKFRHQGAVSDIANGRPPVTY